MNGFVNISPEELLRVSVICLEQHQNYNGEDDKEYEYQKGMFWWKKKSTYKMSPRWTYTGVGIQTQLLQYINIAENKLKDDKFVDRDIHLSLTMYSELYRLTLTRVNIFNRIFLGVVNNEMDRV